ncbi:hypothetical protein Y032_0281g1251 [Ancylostoma ceylanicum]|uniref:Uncharacterized protein n=1 Tax=Ancylostoma ceylanicum TaxID=53326 RepID=A0A016S7I2_9BILA|nr:hypothetical protein Y032_0281g1251 [Ancylostoma ceylanicum]
MVSQRPRPGSKSWYDMLVISWLSKLVFPPRTTIHSRLGPPSRPAAIYRSPDLAFRSSISDGTKEATAISVHRRSSALVADDRKKVG